MLTVRIDGVYKEIKMIYRRTIWKALFVCLFSGDTNPENIRTLPDRNFRDGLSTSSIS